MEKTYYRDILETLKSTFPGRVTITPYEAADVLNMNVYTVYKAIARRDNPLPAVKVGSRMMAIPIAAFAKWLS